MKDKIEEVRKNAKVWYKQGLQDGRAEYEKEINDLKEELESVSAESLMIINRIEEQTSKKVRLVKSCDNCPYWLGFPYVHCSLDCEIENRIVGDRIFKTFPKDFQKCKKKRQLKEEKESDGNKCVKSI